MIVNDDWKKTDDIEIDLADLLKQLCMQWKQILLCALAFAVLAGGYGYVKNKSTAKVQNTDAVQDIELTPEEEQGVQSAVQLYRETAGLEQYLENSLLMRTDPYHKHKIYLLYSIEQAEWREVQKITESYLSFVVNGGAADALQKSGREWDMDKSYLMEIMTAYQRVYSFPFQITADDAAERGIQTESVFYAELTGPDEKTAGSLADDMQKVLEDYSAAVRERAGNHKLKLLHAEHAVTADTGLQSQQHDRRTQLASNRANLKAAVDALNDGQLAVYRREAGTEDEKTEKDAGGKEDGKLDKSGMQDASASLAKYIIFGLAGGIFVYCGIFGCRYLFRDTVKSEEEMKNLYTFPFYGSVPFEKQADERLANRIRLACQKQGITKLCAAAGFSFHAWEKEGMESIARQLENSGIHTVIADDAGSNTGLWDTMAETGNVLLVCRIGTTTHRMIDDAMRFYGENGISVTGAVAFHRHR